VLIKDNVDTADAMQTTAGSLALVGSKPARDAFIVRKLRDAGALLLGKTNLSEWANFRSTRSSSGWSGRGGQTQQPVCAQPQSCGSSSGRELRSRPISRWSQWERKPTPIVCPSSANGLVGIKPTVGLVSRARNQSPISASQDTAGPMARSVADAAILLSVLAGYDPDDPATEPLKSRSPLDYRQFLNRDASKACEWGDAAGRGFHDEVDALFERAIETMRARGAIIVDPATYLRTANSTRRTKQFCSTSSRTG